jgi:hypothetical protein
MTDREKPGEHIANALTLLGAFQSILRRLPERHEEREATELLDAISRRLWKALYQLEPQRRRLAGIDR